MSDFCGSSSGPYRSRKGMIFGVCRGLADYFNFSVFWTRILVVIGFVFTGFWPLGVAYIAAAFLMKPEPSCGYQASPGPRRRPLARPERLRENFDSLDRRLQRLETIVTDPAYDWDRRLRES